MTTKDIHVGDPVTREEVAITRGDTTIYFIRYEDDTSYAVCNEYFDETGHSWKGDIDGIADLIALGDIFDELDEAAAPVHHADDPRSHG